MSEQEILKLLPPAMRKKYKHKPNTIVLIDDKGNPVLTQNSYGTLSGFELKSFTDENKK